ncbi:MAG: UDP-3-O-(3-hydroxymyristoyl)glucosamine N-acyltransferase [Firmicutes bacterium]|nr:UDP-3-O-(3-hydroxymyristoyl)glucosamine N-acyltransferase [Bacillota bacterium]
MATLGELAELVKGKVVGESNQEICGVSGLQDAKPGEISLIASAKVIKLAKESQASAFIFPPNLREFNFKGIEVDHPRLAFAQILWHFHPKKVWAEGIHPSAVIGEDFQHGPGCHIGPQVYIGDRVKLGARVVLHPGVVLNDEVEIGDDTEIHANVVLGAQTIVGQRVIIHPGTVIGGDGFGFEKTPEGKHFKVPQVGRVVLEDDVEIGSNVTIDRATTGQTVIGAGTKIDNLVQIGHNVQIGKDNILVAMSGIAGSTKVGDRVTIAGQSGINGHISIGDDTVIFARSMVISSLEPNSIISGQPARPHAEDMRIQAAAGKLPELLKTVRQLEKRLAELEGKIE